MTRLARKTPPPPRGRAPSHAADCVAKRGVRRIAQGAHPVAHARHSACFVAHSLTSVKVPGAPNVGRDRLPVAKQEHAVGLDARSGRASPSGWTCYASGPHSDLNNSGTSAALASRGCRWASSARGRRRSPAMARAMATRCCPPGGRSDVPCGQPGEPDPPEASTARCSASLPPCPRDPRRAKATLSRPSGCR